MGKPVQECTLLSSGSSKFLMFLYGGLDWLLWFKKLSKHSKLDMECILINRIVIVSYYMNIHIWSESSTKLNISMLSGAQEFQFIASYYVMVQFQYIVFNVHCISIDRYITMRASHYCFKLNNISSCTSKMASC